MDKFYKFSIIKSFHSKRASISLVAFICLLSFNNLQGFNCSSTARGANNTDFALNYLLYSSSTESQANQSIEIQRLLTNSNHSHASDVVNLQLANSIWLKMRQNTQEFARRRVMQVKPVINNLLLQANVSEQCEKSINSVMNRISELELWAMKMYNSFGDFPTDGLFEGSLSAMGSYHQCVNIEPNEIIGKPLYCTFKFQPIVPKRPKFHNILATIDNLANFTEKNDMFYHLAQKAQYYYYIKLRLATCMPSKCAENDFQLLGKQVALNTYLQFAGVNCLAKDEGAKLDGAQIFALTILISLASISVLGTLVHLFDLRSLVEPSSGEANHNGRPKQRTALISAGQTKDCSQGILPKPVSGATSVVEFDDKDDKFDQQQTGLASDWADSMSGGIQSRLLYAFDVLLHFSMIKNAKKLFDTSTSRHQPAAPAAAVRPFNHNGSDSASNSSSSSASGELDPEQEASENLSKTSSDISCVHGLRFWTISWIIFGHTMQYSEWAGFGRAYQVEQNIVSFWLHPLMNATFSVDTFFLISGLLTTYVTWSITRGEYNRFNKFAFLISRYLRLTPQVLLVILLFIIFPLMGDGPYWRGMIQKESDNCKKNWWVNALYLQAFIRQDNICNLVTWWLSIEMFYHFVSIFVIIMLLKSKFRGYLTAILIGGSMTLVSIYLHFSNNYPPNMLPTLLQRYEIWDSIVLKYFWTPYPHAPAYFVGLILGYLLYNKNLLNHCLSKRQIRIGWFIFATCYLSILFGTYGWNNNKPYDRLSSTLYYNLSQILWSFATGWAILACAMGHGGWLNSFLSSPIFVPLGRATYMTYLSHMIIVLSYPAKMNMLIEPSYVVFLYIFISNLFLSYALGIILTLVYESPILHLQKLLVTSMAQSFAEDTNQGANNSSEDRCLQSNGSGPLTMGQKRARANEKRERSLLNRLMASSRSKNTQVSLQYSQELQPQQNNPGASNPC